MPENINTTPLGDIERELAAAVDDRPVMVDVDRVSMVFNMASQQLNSLKEYAIALAKRELMFKEFRALDGVSFTVRKGDVFGILGTNGSGKSTMLKIIAGVLEPTEGTCTINGSIAPLIELGAGFDMELTARENIFLNGALLGYSKKFIQQHFDEIVDFHHRFEIIHPFQDGNGRVGRIVLFQQCLQNGIMPFVVLDSHKEFYYRGLAQYEDEPGFLASLAAMPADALA